MRLLKKSTVKLKKKIPVYDLTSSEESHNFSLGNGVIVHNSKDIADAVSGVVYNLYENLDLAGQLSNKYKVNTYSKQMEARVKKVDVFQDMLKNIY